MRQLVVDSGRRLLRAMSSLGRSIVSRRPPALLILACGAPARNRWVVEGNADDCYGKCNQSENDQGGTTAGYPLFARFQLF